MGPTLPISEEIHAAKHRLAGETFHDATARIADALADNTAHFDALLPILRNQRFLPGGRVSAAVGAPRQTTPYNCFVSRTIGDSMHDIMAAAKEAAITMKAGGGIGYDFSTIRPRGDRIASLDSQASGPVSFMGIFDAVCKTIASAGHRRGAQMGVLRVDHPDIEEFITAKANTHNLTAFNISVGATDEFMDAVRRDLPFDLRWGGRVYKTVRARHLWDLIMRTTWDWAEPGVLFIDTINRMNNLRYVERISATNPCGEQPLPPYGACLLGSFNLTKYMYRDADAEWAFNWELFRQDIPTVVRAMDNVVDVATYPLLQQEMEAHDKRRMGLGITGFANAAEALGHPYGSPQCGWFLNEVMNILKVEAYTASVQLSKEKGCFPLFEDAYLESEFVRRRLPAPLHDEIRRHGTRNSHLISIAPTGTISLTADNVSSGIEPVYSYAYERTIQTPNGPRVETVTDYGVRVFGVKGRTADQCTVADHLRMLEIAQQHVDSAVSKTCNIGDDVTWDEFKDVYMQAWMKGAKGITTFRAAGKRMGILTTKDAETNEEVLACTIDPETGHRSCE